jgi:undecaprenyl-diphosphatase
MDPLQALIMGILQGLTEFLPISSSGHLILLPWLLGWPDPGLTFDVALHMGTLLAVLAYFWSDWVELVKGAIRTITRRRYQDDRQARLFWLLVIASIPGAVVGALAEKAAETWLRAPAIVATLMIGLGILLLLADRFGNQKRQLYQIGLSDAIIVGISQAFAVMPGVSRSGVTITAGLFRGLDRATAARFSFLMSTPIIAGASLFNMRHVVQGGLPVDERLAFGIGVLSAALAGFMSIKLLLYYLQNNSLRVFAYYRFAVGLAVFALLLTGIRR